MMAESNLGATFFHSDVIENTAPQPRADRTISLAFRHQTFDDRVSVALDDAKGHAALTQVVRQNFGRESRLLLIQVDSQQIESHRSAPLYVKQQLQQCVAVLSTRQTDHHAIAIFDHAKVSD